ncbi:Na+/H+ antiporter [Vagococcus lutrae LBD1]|uniref:Na+/H+ antiporter n=1 Tax=Vagococcus lutrae LBD1 TaxID=1408226 RepID=V6Q5R3_9ENTE|nr:sodium:proton antiporter [Vagococcus lutrae]EST90479.1 Na+/H+ antiporter [Vagococcus lutrae LBD1]
MTILVSSIMIIGLVVISNILSHYILFLPTALIEIIIGLSIALIFDVKITLQSDWFMLLFVAPLLFNDAKHYPKNKLWELRAPIFGYAIVLVFFTTVLGGWFVHWLIPSFPLPLAMALIAVLSPTDPVAVQGIAEQVKLPPKLMNLISGESLINDASGLIAFKYALAAFMTGYFSLTKAIGNFFYISLVGALIGILLMVFIHFLKLFLAHQGIQDVVLHAIIQLLTPFVIYITAEHFHASGVIAVVAAGIIAINQTTVFKSHYSETRLVTERMWEILVYILNGVVFVILGVELPDAMSETIANPNINNTLLIIWILAIWFVLLSVRVLWSYAYMWWNFFDKNHPKVTRPLFKEALLTGITGVRGAVTMATIMSMPFIMDNGRFFKERALMIALACGVVVTSLLVATFTLPIMTKRKGKLLLVGDEGYRENILVDAYQDTGMLTELEARKLMTQNAIKSLKNIETAENERVTSDLIHELNRRLQHLHKESHSNDTHHLYADTERLIQQIAINGEKEAIHRLIESEKVSLATGKDYLSFLNSKESILYSNWRYFFHRISYNTLQKLEKTFMKQRWQSHHETSWLNFEYEATKGAIQALKTYQIQLNAEKEPDLLRKQIAQQKQHEYYYKLQWIKFSQMKPSEDYDEQLLELYNMTVYSERKTIHDLYTSGKITLDTANRLRQSLLYYEGTLLQRELAEKN